MNADATYRLVPAKRGPEGWYPSWTVTGLERATRSAQTFLETEGVAVLVSLADANGFSTRTVAIIGAQTRRGKQIAA